MSENVIWFSLFSLFLLLTLNTSPSLIWWALWHANAQVSQRENQKENQNYVSSSVYTIFATYSYLLAVNGCEKWRFSKTSCSINVWSVFVQEIRLGSYSLNVYCSTKDKMYWNGMNQTLELH